jgi:hypothetical protein
LRVIKKKKKKKKKKKHVLEPFALKLAQAKAIIWPGLAYCVANRSKAACDTTQGASNLDQTSIV